MHRDLPSFPTRRSSDLFYPYVTHDEVRLIGIEAAGYGLESGKHAATLCTGKPGVLHGNRTYLMQDDNGQIIRSEEHTSELQSRLHLVCRLLLEKKNATR